MEKVIDLLLLLTDNLCNKIGGNKALNGVNIALKWRQYSTKVVAI